MTTCEFSGGFSGEKKNEVQGEWYESKTISIWTGHPSFSWRTKGCWRAFGAFQLSFPAFLLPCTPLLCLLSIYLIPQREFIDHTKGSEPLSSDRSGVSFISAHYKCIKLELLSHSWMACRKQRKPHRNRGTRYLVGSRLFGPIGKRNLYFTLLKSKLLLAGDVCTSGTPETLWQTISIRRSAWLRRYMKTKTKTKKKFFFGNG